MAENGSFWSAEFQFDASSAVTAKNVINSFVDALGKAVKAGTITEQAANKVAQSMLDVGMAAGKAVGGLDRYGQATLQAARGAAQLRRQINGEGFRASGFEQGLLRQIRGVESVNAALARAMQKASAQSAGVSEGVYNTDSVASGAAIEAEARARADASAQLKSYMQAKYAAIAAEQREIAALNGTAAAVGRSSLAYKELSASVAAAARRSEATGRFQSPNRSTQSGNGLLQGMVNLPGLNNSVALATQKAKALSDADEKVAAAAKAAGDAQKALASQLRTASSAKDVLASSIASGTNNFASGGLLQSIPKIKALGAATEGLVLPMSRATRGAKELSNEIGNFYPLIVSAGVLGTIAKASIGLGVASVKTAADYQSSFAQVVRTTTISSGDVGTQIKSIRDGLIDLSSGIPVAFQDLSQIATLGNQLGISAENVVAFTKTVAQFSSVTGVTTEETAKSFGSLSEILNVNAADYDRLGSAITYVGRNSVATEAEILTMSQKIGATAAQAGFSAQEVIGLSGALSSLREAPERSQGALELFFGKLNHAVADGGKQLENFATVIGQTKEQTADLIKTDPYEFFRRFLGSLSKMSSAQRTSTLDALGLSGIRVSEVMRRLATNLSVVDKAQQDATNSWSKGTDLASQYGVTVETLQAQFSILTNNVNNLLDAMSNSGALNSITLIVKALSEMVKGVTDFVNVNPGMANAFLVVATGIGVFAALRTAIILAAIATAAFQGAAGRVGVTSLFGAVGQLTSALFGTRTAGIAAAEGMTVAGGAAGFLRVAIAALFRATILLGVLAAASELVFNFGGSMQAIIPIIGTLVDYDGILVQSFLNIGAALATTAQRIFKVAGSIASVVPFLGGVAQQINTIAARIGRVANAARAAAASVPDIGNTIKGGFADWAKSLPTTSTDVADYSKQMGNLGAQANELTKNLGGIPSGALPASKSLGDVGKNAGETAEKVRTLTDYASDLSGVFDRAFQLRFDVQGSKDDIASQFQTMRNSARDAAQAIQDAKDKIRSIRAEISKLKADNKQQEYFLSVANQFGDTLRAGEISAKIDSNNADIAGKNTELSGAKKAKNDAEDSASTNLKGNTKGAIENRKALRDLVEKYKDYISKLAASGLSQKELTKKVEEAKRRFNEQAESLGYNKRQVDPYLRSLDDLIQIIKRVPRDITVKANADPAIQALREFEAKARETAKNVKNSLGGNKGISVPGIQVESTPDGPARALAIKAEIAAYSKLVTSWFKSHDYMTATVANWMDIVARDKNQLKGYSEGGYTGPGGKYQPAGVVHAGEYVIPKHQVNQRTGLPYADALGRLVKGSQGRQNYAGGGYVDPGMSVVELGPASMRVLRSAIQTEVKAVISAERTASAVNSVNSTRRRRGGDGA